MPCHEIVNDGKVVGHICQPTGTVAPVLGKRRKRFWCFLCRKHLLHTRMVLIPEPMSYYGPNFWWECPQCHEEHVLFPGWEWTERE